MGRKRSLVIFGILQSIAIALYFLPALKIVDLPVLYLASIIVQITLSMASTAQFTVMMNKSGCDTAGTDYTLQASFLFLSTIIASAVAGLLAEYLGYAAVFAIAIVIGLAGVLLIAQTFDGQRSIE